MLPRLASKFRPTVPPETLTSTFAFILLKAPASKLFPMEPPFERFNCVFDPMEAGATDGGTLMIVVKSPRAESCAKKDRPTDNSSHDVNRHAVVEMCQNMVRVAKIIC